MDLSIELKSSFYHFFLSQAKRGKNFTPACLFLLCNLQVSFSTTSYLLCYSWKTLILNNNVFTLGAVETFRCLSLQSSQDLLSQNLMIEMSIMVFFVFIIVINMQAEKTMLTNYWGLKNMCKAFIPMLDPQVIYCI